MNAIVGLILAFSLVGAGLGIVFAVIDNTLGIFASCNPEQVIDDVLEHNGYIAGDKKERLKKELMYDCKYHHIDRYDRIVARLRQLEREDAK